MNLQDEIKDLTLGFFQRINSEITENDGLYCVTVPEKYQNYFQDSSISFSFDRDAADKHNVQLIIPGSNLLSLIMLNCKQKGPISPKSSLNSKNIAIRYHFFVSFSGVHSISRLEYVDVDLATSEIINVSGTLKESDFSLHDKFDSKKITTSYVAALDDLKKRCVKMRDDFLTDAQQRFAHDFELFVTKYETQIRELDDSINKKEDNSDDFEKVQKFRFDTVDEIKRIEKEKKQLEDTLQEKHKINLEYGLVACELIYT